MRKHLPVALTVVVCLLLGIVAALRSPRDLRVERRSGPPAAAAASPAPDPRAKVPVPRFDLSASGSRKIASLLDPSSRRYDPRAALVVQSAKDLFEREPRNERWAAPLEAALTIAVQRDLAQLPGADKMTVECRTTTCRFSYDAVGKDGLTLTKVVTALYGGSGGGGGPYGHIAIYRGGPLDAVDTTNPDALIPALLQARDEKVASIHARYLRGEQVQKLPESTWPER